MFYIPETDCRVLLPLFSAISYTGCIPIEIACDNLHMTWMTSCTMKMLVQQSVCCKCITLVLLLLDSLYSPSLN